MSNNAADTKPADAPVRGPSYLGRPIRKQIFNLGVAGVIERSEEDPATPPEATVTFQAKAHVSAIKHKFTEHGGIEESTILAIDGSSFQILGVDELETPPELPFDGVDQGDGEDA